MISKSLSTSEKFASLADVAPDIYEFCHALYPLLVPHTDDFGRLQGDPFTVKHVCYPASKRDLAEFAEGLRQLHEAELIIWYTVGGKKYIQIVKFDDHQSGLHKRTRSQFPRVPGSSGNDPETPGSMSAGEVDAGDNSSRKFREIPGQVNGREEKRTEENRTIHTREEEPQTNELRVEAAFKAAWREAYGYDCSLIANQLEFMKLSQHLKKYPVEQMLGAIAAYFATDESYVRKQKHAYGVFLRDPLKYLATEAKAPQQRPKGCGHTPVCIDEAEHTRRRMADKQRVS